MVQRKITNNLFIFSTILSSSFPLIQRKHLIIGKSKKLQGLPKIDNAVKYCFCEMCLDITSFIYRSFVNFLWILTDKAPRWFRDAMHSHKCVWRFFAHDN